MLNTGISLTSNINNFLFSPTIASISPLIGEHEMALLEPFKFIICFPVLLFEITSCEFTINPLPSLETNNSFSFFESLKNRIFSSAISSKTSERGSPNPRPVGSL